MAEGYLVSPQNFKRLQRMVHAFEGEPRSRPRLRTRKAVFPPGAGSKVYQCVHGMRLRPGTVTDDEDTSRHEPVVLCVELGNIGESDLETLRHQDMFNLQQRVNSFALISDSDGTVDQARVDQYGKDETITNLVKEQIDKDNGIVALRCRNAQGYIGAGSIVVGNDTEVWIGGTEVFEAELQEKIDDGEAFTKARIIWNEEAIDLETIPESFRLYDTVFVRDPQQRAAIYIPNETIVQVEFNQQVLFSDDDSDTNENDSPYWHSDEEIGILPVFNLIYTQLPLVGKADGTITQDTDGTVSIWDGDTSDSLTDSGDNLEAFARYGDVDSAVFCEVMPHKFGWEVIQQPCS